MLPSSVEVLASTLTARPFVSAEKSATGGSLPGSGWPPGVAASRLSYRAVTGALVLEPERYVTRPTPPGTCMAAVLSVVVTCQSAGSVPPTFHTLADSSVGLLPTASNWRRRTSPVLYTSPGTVTAARDCSTPLTTRKIVRVVEVGRTRTRAR
jgi:hypothetical protein